MLVCGFLIPSCRTTSGSEKYYEKQDEMRAEEEQKEYDSKVERHQKMQSKNTLKSQKKLEKESKVLNKPRKPKLKKCWSFEIYYYTGFNEKDMGAGFAAICRDPSFFVFRLFSASGSEIWPDHLWKHPAC